MHMCVPFCLRVKKPYFDIPYLWHGGPHKQVHALCHCPYYSTSAVSQQPVTHMCRQNVVLGSNYCFNYPSFNTLKCSGISLCILKNLRPLNQRWDKLQILTNILFGNHQGVVMTSKASYNTETEQITQCAKFRTINVKYELIKGIYFLLKQFLK